MTKHTPEISALTQLADMTADIQGALQDSAYLAGLKAGWNCGVDNDQARYQRIVDDRRGYLAPLTAARAALAKASTP